jgi:flagellar motor switch protein FliM
VSSETLSQNEIDALLGGSRSGGATPSAVASRAETDPAAEAQNYDFRRPRRVSNEKLRTLQATYDRFAKALEGWLLGRVRGKVQLTVQSIEQFSFNEFTLSLSTPCASFIADVTESGGQQAVIDFGSDFAFYLVDRLFGGGTEPSVANRPLTPIERMAVRTAAERMWFLLSEAWSDYVDIKFEMTGFESIPEILRAANPEDPVLVANIEVVAAGTRSLLLICLPFAVLDKFFAGGSERRVTMLGSTTEIAATRGVTEGSVRSTRVDVAARLPEFRLSMQQLLDLKPGSILATGLPRTALLDVLVAGQSRFQATPGRLGSTLAVRLLDRVGPAPESAPSPLTRK